MQRIQGKMLNRRALHSRLPRSQDKGQCRAGLTRKSVPHQNRIDAFKRSQIDLNCLGEG